MYYIQWPISMEGLTCIWNLRQTHRHLASYFPWELWRVLSLYHPWIILYFRGLFHSWIQWQAFLQSQGSLPQWRSGYHNCKIIVRNWISLVYLLRAVFISFVKLLVHFFSEDFFAFLANHDHFMGPLKLMVLSFSVAFRAIEPLFAARGSDSNLGIHDVLAHIG